VWGWPFWVPCLGLLAVSCDALRLLARCWSVLGASWALRVGKWLWCGVCRTVCCLVSWSPGYAVCCRLRRAAVCPGCLGLEDGVVGSGGSPWRGVFAAWVCSEVSRSAATCGGHHGRRLVAVVSCRV